MQVNLIQSQHQRPKFNSCHNEETHKGMSVCHTRCDLEDNGTYNPAHQSKPIAPRRATLAEHMCRSLHSPTPPVLVGLRPAVTAKVFLRPNSVVTSLSVYLP